MDRKRESKSGMNWEIGTDIYTLLILCVKYITNENLLYIAQETQCSNFLSNGKEIQKRGGVCTHMADSLCYTVEINTPL